MLKNYFKIAWRNLVRQKVYALINIAGLATGISACILIFLFIQDELTYERNFSQTDRIYRVVSEVNMQGQSDKFATTPYLLTQELGVNYPEVQAITKILAAKKQTVWINEKPFNEEDLFFADSTFFRVFDYSFVQGDPNTALNEPKTIVLTEELAVKFFGSAAGAMGQTLQFSKNPHKVTGVIRNPGHSHLQISGLLSAVTLGPASSDINAVNSATNWILLSWYTYVLLPDKTQAPALQQKLNNLSAKIINPWLKENQLTASQYFRLQPIRDIHLNTEWQGEISPAGNKSYLYIFGFVALFVLLIACINYMNLATARSAKRAREVGLRKVVGAHRSQLIRQFIGESVFITLFAVLLALALVEILLPYFNSLTQKTFSLIYFTDTTFLLALLGIIIFVGLVAGSYPAFFLSSFKPAQVLKADKSPAGGNALLRRFLVVLQFAVSIVMIIGTIVVFSQMQFIKNANLGFRKEQVLIIDIPTGDTTLVKHLPRIKQELLRNPRIGQVANSAYIPGEETNRLVSLVEQNGKQEEKTSPIIFVDDNFLNLLSIPVIQGRNFSKEMPTDLKGSVLVNQSMVNKMEWHDPLGKKIQFADWDAKVVGVVHDFHVSSLHNPIEPLILALAPQSAGYLLIRVQTNNMPATIRFIEQKWKNFDPKHPLEYFFLDEFFNKQYRAEEKMLLIFGYFAALTILIACLGLYGLTAYTAEQRTREIGIRKVLGSSVPEIIVLLSKDFALLVIIAIVVACPVAWFGMHQWLQDFTYRTPINGWIFLFTSLFAMFISLLTVILQALKAATNNPVKALRSE